jgi:hypothetical protein
MSALPSQDRNRFAAPWCRPLIAVTAFTSLLLPLVTVLVWTQTPPTPAWGRGLVTALSAGLLVGGAVFMIRGYRLEGRRLWIRRLFWDTQVSLDGLRGAVVDPEAMRRSLRLFGNGGLFVFAGWYRNRRLGVYRAFATDPARAVVLTLPRRKIVITPADPEGFVRALESRHG